MKPKRQGNRQNTSQFDQKDFPDDRLIWFFPDRIIAAAFS